MTTLIFKMSDNGDNYAEYDIIGDYIEIYAPELLSGIGGLYLFGENLDDYLIALTCGIISHEYFHACVTNSDVEVTSEQEHNIMEEIGKFLNKDLYLS